MSLMRSITFDEVEVPESAFTLEGFREWVASMGEHGPRVHFWRGRIHLEMSPQNYKGHEPIVHAVDECLGRLARELDRGRFFFPPSWITHPTGLSTEPDGFLVLWESFEKGLVQISPERESELLGRPDLALAVVSPSSRKKDLRDLVKGYAAAGTSEYWIVDVRKKGAFVFRILVLDPDGAYVDQETDPDGWIASPLWGRSFRLERFVDRAGLDDYRLVVR